MWPVMLRAPTATVAKAAQAIDSHTLLGGHIGPSVTVMDQHPKLMPAPKAWMILRSSDTMAR